MPRRDWRKLLTRIRVCLVLGLADQPRSTTAIYFNFGAEQAAAQRFSGGIERFRASAGTFGHGQILSCYRTTLSVNSFGKESLQEDVMPAIAKITSKGQTTIPAEVRESLNFNPGDLLEWEVNADGSARVRRIQPLDLEYMRAVEGTLTEWGCAEDEEAYRGL